MALVLSCAGAFGCASRPAKIVIGRSTSSPLPPVAAATAEPTLVPERSEVPIPSRLQPKPGLGRATGTGPRGAIAFRGAVNVPGDLLFFLVIGSDARPGEDMARTRADSIHVIAVDPAERRGTVLGIPRDAYVDVPGHGMQKINAALPLGGPRLVVATVRNLTGFPVSYYALTGFEGIVAMVDELDGLDVFVAERMDDPSSGARFERGWHHMDGRQVLAFTRNRHIPGGDLARSKNHGAVVLHALEKARAVIADEGGIRHWLGVLYRHARLDMGLEDAMGLGALARSIVPDAVANVVASGRGENVQGQSVVILDDAAYALFRDVGADAVADGDTDRPAPPPTVPPATPAPTPEPPASPVATPVRLPIP